MKTFDKQDIFTCVTAEEAITYIGNNGYFANSLSGFNHIDCFAPYSLDEVQIGTDKPFVYKKESYALFLPANKIKEVEEPKKWRAFKDIGEFQCVTNKFIGDIIEVKSDWDDRAYRCLIMWATEGYIGMAGLRFSLLIDLFEHYQWKDSNNEWQRFGVEE